MSVKVACPSSGSSRPGLAILTPSSTRWPSCRLRAEMIGSRRCRSISFCTKLVGTESRAKPSVMTSGLTSFNQALCCGVRLGDGGSPLTESPGVVSPFSSARTVFHTATKGGSGSAVNDGYPLKLVHGTTKRTQTNCPHSYPQPVEEHSPSLCCLPAGPPRGFGLVTVVPSAVGSRPGRASSLRCLVAVPGVGTALAEANSFLPECQPFCNIARGHSFWQRCGGDCCD